MKIFRALNEHSMAAPCEKLTMSRGDDGDAGGMVPGWPALRGGTGKAGEPGLRVCTAGEATTGSYHQAGVTTRLGRVTRGWFTDEKSMPLLVVRFFFGDFTGYIHLF